MVIKEPRAPIVLNIRWKCLTTHLALSNRWGEVIKPAACCSPDSTFQSLSKQSCTSNHLGVSGYHGAPIRFSTALSLSWCFPNTMKQKNACLNYMRDTCIVLSNPIRRLFIPLWWRSCYKVGTESPVSRSVFQIHPQMAQSPRSTKEVPCSETKQGGKSVSESV